MAKRSTPELNAGSMADIAFLLLSFFLLTTTMEQNIGMPRRLPPMIEQQEKEKIEINKRNILQVHVNSYDRLLVDGKPMESVLLKDVVKTFITNPNNEDSKPEKEKKEVKGLGVVEVSKGVVSLQTDRGTSYKIYMAVQNEIMKAYTELREEFSNSRFGNTFNKLTEDQQEAVRGYYPLNISEAEPRDATKSGSKGGGTTKRRR
ncbi:MAG: biopolymer transporter ExbD [Prevotellaceae bacterium]|jgi:biopolymer transport protein ExbD|nr:biopolymer transporter ExbD [Prevotellaceae bacterium]